MWRSLTIEDGRVRIANNLTRHDTHTHTKLSGNWKFVNVILSRNSCTIEMGKQ